MGIQWAQESIIDALIQSRKQTHMMALSGALSRPQGRFNVQQTFHRLAKN